MAYDPSIFNISPYYDDFDPNNRFLRVLFKPGYAVQARELTQLQTILQNQVSKIGDHLFKNGSRIVAAPITVRNANYLGLNTGTGTPFAAFDSNDWESLVGGTVYLGATAQAVIAHVLPPETDDKLFLVVDYVSGYSGLIPSNGVAPYVNGVTVGITAADGSSYTPFVPKGATYNGLCKLVTVDDGIFYVDGSFVVNEQQSFAPYSVSGGERDLSGTVAGVTFAGIDKKVGFSISRTTVTSDEDNSLLDPSFGSPNYNAPGADRYVIDLTLSQTGLADNPDDFIELVRFEDGKITKKVDRVLYSDILQTLSKRTYDESGSYIVNPFEITVRESSAPENLEVVIGPGKAYVMGTEVETKYPTILGISKARQDYTESGSFQFNVGNFIGVCMDNIANRMGATAYTHMNRLNGGSSVVQFRNSGGAVVGEAKVHGFIPRGVSAWAGFVTSSITAGQYTTAGTPYNMYIYGVCSGSVISGACSAVVYGFSGGIAGVTFAVLTPVSGISFGVIGASANDDGCLVYELSPTQGISALNSVVFYGKAVTKSSTLWTGSASANWIVGGFTGATFSFSSAEFDLPSIPSNMTAVWSDAITTSHTTNDTLLSQYTIISGGITAGLVINPGVRDGSVASAGIYRDGSGYVKLSVRGFHAGFTGPVRIIAPYKYTITSSDLVNTNAVNACSRTKTSQVYSNAGTVIPKLANINGRVGFTLPNFDVYSVTEVRREGINITDDFELDDGQRDSFYDYSALVVKKSKEGTSVPGSSTFTYSVGQQPTGVSFAYKWFRHEGLSFGPFLGRHAYVGITYGDIPLFTNPKTGRTVSLANCVDFRHTGLTFDAVVSKPYGVYERFDASYPTGATWSNYLPRIDRISLKINPSDLSTSFAVDTGEVGDLSPVSPPETENSLTLATLVVPAYTHSAKDVVVNKNDVRRFTMADIQSVEKRVDELESFTKLSLSETEMEFTSIKSAIDSYVSVGGVTSASVYSLSTEPVKTSIYTDDFYGHAGGDVADTNHRCSVDYEYGEMRPMFIHNDLELPSLSTGTYTNTTVSPDGLITFSYTTEELLDNSGYNNSIKINPTGTVNWLGFIDLTKQYEPYFETSVRPTVYSNNLSENDNWVASNANNTRGFGTQWNDWEYMWTGFAIRTDAKDDIQKRILEAPRTNSDSSIPTVNSGNERMSVRRSVVPIDEKTGNILTASRLVGRTRYRTLDNRIVDRTVVPYIPVNQNIGVTAYGLRPNSNGLGLYVDGVLVKSGLTTNANGTVGVTFSFTSGNNLSGEKSIRITDSATTQNATQAADKIFYCKGTVDQRIDGVYSTRNPEYRRQTVTSEGIIKDPFNREVSYDNIQETIQNNSWIDPLCQTFVVDKKTYPEGIFAKSVTLYFSAKDSALPVTVQLRPTVNGYPSPSVSFPFSTVTLMPSQVSTGTVGTTTTPNGTTFTFSSPVYLEPGEYAIAVITNSKNYELRANDSGINLTTGGRSSNPFVGTLYQPQSVGPAAQNLSTDIAFKVDMCSFTANSSGTANFVPVSPFMDVANCQVLKVSVPVITPTGCNYSMRIDPAASARTVYNNQNTYLTSVYTASQNFGFSLSKPSKTYISPAIDAGLFYGVGAEMLVTSTNDPNTRTTTPSSSYVSKAVSLPDELVSNGIFVTGEVCCPTGSQVRAYVRWSENGESDLFGKSWVQMTAVNGIGSPRFPFTATSNLSRTEYDFRPTQWAWFNTGSTVRAYQILLMYTTTLGAAAKTYSKLPATRNLRMCSFRSV